MSLVVSFVVIFVITVAGAALAGPAGVLAAGAVVVAWAFGRAAGQTGRDDYHKAEHLGYGHCPRCGQAIVEYSDSVIEGGYEMQRKWRVCPTFRDRGANCSEHVGSWQRGKYRPAPRIEVVP